MCSLYDMIWYELYSSAGAEICLATQQPLHVKTENMNYTHWHDTLKHNKFTYMGTDSREHIVHHFAYLRFSIKVDWWTKYFFSLTFLKSGTSYLLPEGNNLYSLYKTWLVFEVMFFANLSMLLSYVEVYSSWSGCPTIFEQMFSCCNICDFRATDRHPYQVVLQYWRTLIMTEVKNKRRILLLAPKDLKRRRK